MKHGVLLACLLFNIGIFQKVIWDAELFEFRKAKERLEDVENPSMNVGLQINKNKTKLIIYCSETWTLTKPDETLLATFGRKILLKIYGAVQEVNVWRHSSNDQDW